MLHHQFVRVFARLFSKLSVERNVSSNDRLESRSDRPQKAPGTDNDAAHGADVAHDTITGQFCGGCHQSGFYAGGNGLSSCTN
jgi:hypothetical protein